MQRTYTNIVAGGPVVRHGDNITTREALVIAYNAIENDVMHGNPHRRQALAIIRALLIMDVMAT